MIFNKNLNIFLIIFIFSKNIFFSQFAIWLDIFYLIIFNFILFLFNQQNNLYKTNLYILLIFSFLSFCFYFGSNVEINRLLNQSSILSFTSIALIFFKNINFKYKEISIHVFVLLFLLNFNNFINKFKSKEYYTGSEIIENTEIFESKYNQKLFDNLKIRKELNEFNKNFENLLDRNNWKPNEILIDATLKHPGILLIANAKFVDSPWYFHNKEKLISSLNSSNIKKPPWFIVVSKNLKNKKILLTKFKNTSYKKIGTLQHPYTKKIIDLYKPLY